MSPLLDTLLQAALAAGEVILRHYEAGATATAKADGSPVTAADREAEALILAALHRFDPGIPVVAEEEAEAGRLPEGEADRFFLVDPLDGTREFVGRNGDFTVNIALIEHGAPVAGIVFAPVCGRLFLGEGGRAFEAAVEDGHAGTLRPIAVRAAPARPVAVASRSHRTPETGDWLDRHAITHTVSRGSSLKFCLLAAGEADVYPRLGRTMEWDTAAGDAVLRAAGGRVVTLDGAPLRYGKRRQPREADYANPHFLAFGDPAGMRWLASPPANPAAV
ncbi:MAG: 3'(2'),5'-bisphosphate nucleotidase CysQ [Methylobacterium sp.]